MYDTFFGGASCPMHPEATVSRGFGVWAEVYRLTEGGDYFLREYESVMRYQHGCNVCVREEVRDWGDWKPVSVDAVPEDVRAELAELYAKSEAECAEYNARELPKPADLDLCDPSDTLAYVYSCVDAGADAQAQA